MRNASLLLVLFLLAACNGAKKSTTTSTPFKNQPMTGFEKNSNTTATYQETISYYEKLAERFDQFSLQPFGMTDSGYPLHVGVLSKDKDFDPVSIRKKGKAIFLINNAIHPGEPCGVDASMMLMRDYLSEKSLQAFLEKVVVVVIPFYNIGGGLNRNSTTRANQDGPEAHGFRGNARNYDLNRDFVKCDTKNGQTFNQIFNKWQPDVFVDTHTSNGADYQYTMTLISTQKDKLESAMSNYMMKDMLPKLYADMKSVNWEMIPYVFARKTPDEGFAAFLDLPRYSSGYAVLHNTISFMPETHMLKPFEDRVKSTYAFLDCMIRTVSAQKDELLAARKQANKNIKNQQTFDVNWTMDFEQSEMISFKGFEAKYKKSEVTGQSRLYYDRSAPYQKEVPYYNTYKVTKQIEKPYAYIIPQAYTEVINRLEWNGVEMKRLSKDQEFELEMYIIDDYKSSKTPYEGHYLHSNVQLKKVSQNWLYRKGDYVIKTDQITNRYIVEMLEPEAPDSFFAWNFFDGILMQKEHFSAYVFEDLAAELLRTRPDIKKAFEAKKAEDEEFANDARAQLNYIYEQSPHYENTHRLYPVGRMLKEQVIAN